MQGVTSEKNEYNTTNDNNKHLFDSMITMRHVVQTHSQKGDEEKLITEVVEIATANAIPKPKVAEKRLSAAARKIGAIRSSRLYRRLKNE
ncbi:hypothetical protein AVEN_259362-1 [Araneus ventricosus]|uniref:Uncharacterized protein n=1 Tax=Araneus ventricosus TaxID=182803 RepID=A0A4Y2DUF6_ARAVE|nr:hypothetical protein AVEN_259362-1 [Araneus ventricosus]